MTPWELLARAIALAHPVCLECGSDLVVVEERPGLGPIPVWAHYAPTMDTACPALRGGVASWLAHEDLWAALEPHLFLAHYGEPADLAVANDELAAL